MVLQLKSSSLFFYFGSKKLRFQVLLRPEYLFALFSPEWSSSDFGHYSLKDSLLITALFTFLLNIQLRRLKSNQIPIVNTLFTLKLPVSCFLGQQNECDIRTIPFFCWMERRMLCTICLTSTPLALSSLLSVHWKPPTSLYNYRELAPRFAVVIWNIIKLYTYRGSLGDIIYIINIIIVLFAVERKMCRCSL